MADASLFFCPKESFDEVWQQIADALVPNGIFCSSFLGTEDTMVTAEHNKNTYWSDVLSFTEAQVKKYFFGFELVSFREHKHSGITPTGDAHDWHIYSVIAIKSCSGDLLERQKQVHCDHAIHYSPDHFRG